MVWFNVRVSSVLICTDVAAMGLDVDDLNMSINIGNTGTRMTPYIKYL